MTRYIAALLLLLSTSSFAIPVQPVRWELHDVTFANGNMLTGFVDFDVWAGIPGWGAAVGFDLLMSDGREFTPDNTSFESDYRWGFGTIDLYLTLPVFPATAVLSGPLGSRADFIPSESNYRCGECSVEYLPGGHPYSNYNGLVSGYIIATAYPYGIEPSVIPEPDTVLVMLLPLIGLMLIDFKRDRRQPSALRLP